MVAWWWIPISLAVGANLGLITSALLRAADEADGAGGSSLGCQPFSVSGEWRWQPEKDPDRDPPDDLDEEEEK